MGLCVTMSLNTFSSLKSALRKEAFFFCILSRKSLSYFFVFVSSFDLSSSEANRFSSLLHSGLAHITNWSLLISFSDNFYTKTQVMDAKSGFKIQNLS